MSTQLPEDSKEVGSARRRPLVKFIDDGIVECIASVCHEANRAYCETQGDKTQPSWIDAPQWQRDSARFGVRAILTGEITTPEQSHESWSRMKLDEGWRYGPVKNPETKEHPCLVPYIALPKEQQMKDFIFHGIVHSMARGANA